MNILQELEKVEREIVRATREMDQAEGKTKAMTEALKKEFDLSPKQIDKHIKDLEKQQKTLAVKIEKKFKELQEEYDLP